MLSEQTFKNPPNKYRPIPFWFWNSKLRTTEIEAQIFDFHSKGIGGFFIHARFGLETEYLSRDWMDCVKCAIDTAKRLGMEVWLYDENGFPSGIGDLKVSRIKEYRSKFIDLTEGDVDSSQQIELNLPSGEVLMAYAYPKNNPSGEKIDLASIIFENKLIWDAPSGDWSVVVYSRCTLEDPNDVVFGVDYLNPEAMRYFFDFTFDPYERAVGEHFGKTIKGIFTDEPTLLPWHHDLNWYGKRSHTRLVVWSDLIAPEMKSIAGLDVKEFLPHMFFDINEDTPAIRRTFWRVISDLYMKSFFDPYKKWCNEHNLKFTGHVLFEEGLYINTDFQADFTAPLSRMDIPGTDHLACVTESTYGGFSNLPVQLTNVQGEKLVSSMAHLMDKDTVISETYGCAGWGLDFCTMKKIADFQYTLGINMLCPHAMFYSIEGFRKTDAPPSQNHMAGWAYYKIFADYIGRLSYMLREGKHVAKIALLYPLSSFWGKHVVGQVLTEDKTISDTFDLCASLLLKLHLDYDIIPEDILASAHIENGKIYVGGEEYELLIAPLFALDGQAKTKLDEFTNQGGKWIEPPKVLGTDNIEEISSMLNSAVREAINPDVEITTPDGSIASGVRYIHRVDNSKHIYFFANSEDKPIECNITLDICGAFEEWNPETGHTEQAKSVELRENRVHIYRTLPPYSSTIYVVDSKEAFEAKPIIKTTREELSVFSDEWRFEALGPNALILDNWSFTPKIGSAGSVYTYKSSFYCDFVPKELRLMLDDIEYRSSLMGNMDIKIQINSEIWHNPLMGSYIDKGFKTLDISKAVELGKNNIEIAINHSAWSGQPHLLNSPPVLLGDFAFHKESKAIIAPVEAAQMGSWTDFGYSLYSGSAIYSHSFRVPKDLGAMRLILSIDSVGDMAEISINSKTAKTCLWQPWEADITDLVKTGTNMVSIKITNTMANFLEQTPRESGLMGRVRLLGEKRS